MSFEPPTMWTHRCWPETRKLLPWLPAADWRWTGSNWPARPSYTAHWTSPDSSHYGRNRPADCTGHYTRPKSCTGRTRPRNTAQSTGWAHLPFRNTVHCCRRHNWLSVSSGRGWRRNYCNWCCKNPKDCSWSCHSWNRRRCRVTMSHRRSCRPNCRVCCCQRRNYCCRICRRHICRRHPSHNCCCCCCRCCSCRHHHRSPHCCSWASCKSRTCYFRRNWRCRSCWRSLWICRGMNIQQKTAHFKLKIWLFYDHFIQCNVKTKLILKRIASTKSMVSSKKGSIIGRLARRD